MYLVHFPVSYLHTENKLSIVPYYGRYAPGAYARPAYAPTISFHEIAASLRADGLRPISRPVFSGRFIVVRAVDRNGDVVRVLLHPRYGDIVSVMRLPPAPTVSPRLIG